MQRRAQSERPGPDYHQISIHLASLPRSLSRQQSALVVAGRAAPVIDPGVAPPVGACSCNHPTNGTANALACHRRAIGGLTDVDGYRSS